MQVREGMSSVVLTVGPDHSLQQAAAQMAERKVGAAVVMDPQTQGPGILTERDLLASIAAGQEPASERVGDHMTDDPLFAAPDWSLEQAAVAMIRGGFRHIIVIEGAEVAGILSMRDVVRCWTDDGASCEVPAPPQIAAAG
jgi:CBS domain-containing protein